jgi:hypothetical protein
MREQAAETIPLAANYFQRSDLASHLDIEVMELLDA